MAKGNGYKQKVDRAAELDLMIKELQEELRQLKDELKKMAIIKEVGVLQGHRFVADFGTYTRTELDAGDLFYYLWNNNRLEQVPKYMRPNMTAVNKDLKKELSDHIKTFSDPWGRITFKPIRKGGGDHDNILCRRNNK